MYEDQEDWLWRPWTTHRTTIVGTSTGGWYIAIYVHIYGERVIAACLPWYFCSTYIDLLIPQSILHSNSWLRNGESL